MRAQGTFTVKDFKPTATIPIPDIRVGMPVGVSTMEKTFAGEIDGHSATLFTAAYDQASGRGTYVAMECFDGALNGKRGSFAFVHAASTTGSDRDNEYCLIVAGSGTGDLATIQGSGAMTIDSDGTHHMMFDYSL